MLLASITSCMMIMVIGNNLARGLGILGALAIIRESARRHAGGEAEEQALAALARDGDVGSRFYASLYLSLYHESLGDKALAEKRMREAVGTDYARGGGQRDPMVELAKVAMQRRGWQ